jgi:FKBP-type peptidyl-prolyl cis-trans isomerase
MRLAVALAAFALAFPALAQQPGSQPPTGQPPATGQPAATGQPPATGPKFEVQPVKPQAIPVPDGPVVKKQELEGGLILEDIKIGEGYEVKPGGAVVAYYHGTLKDGGKVFDSAFERGEPVAFPLTGVIMGWQKGVPGMKVGGVRRLTIPSAMAYGPQGAGADIPPNADLVFVIQLVDALQIEDTKVGEGEEASGQFVAVTAHTIKDKDGKEIEKVEAAHPYIWIPGEFQGIQFGLEGMKPGGHRKITVPKEMNVTAPQANSNRPQNVPLTIEVDLLALRNLGQRRR